jgi:hypothetical protein
MEPTPLHPLSRPTSWRRSRRPPERPVRSRRSRRAARTCSVLVVAALASAAAVSQPATAQTRSHWGPFHTARDLMDQQFVDSLYEPWTFEEQERVIVDVERGYPAEQAIERLVTDRRSFGAIVRFYYTLFGRDPDTDGLLYWSEQRRTGWDLWMVLDVLSRSQEYQDTYGGLDNGAFLDVVYENVLHRAPDAAGRAYWLDLLDSFRLSRVAFLYLFAGSNEHVELTRNRVDRTSVHAAMLREVPSSDWLDMTAGTPITQVIDDVLHGPDYAARF